MCNNFFHILKTVFSDLAQEPKKANKDFNDLNPSLVMLAIFFLIFFAIASINILANNIGFILEKFIF